MIDEVFIEVDELDNGNISTEAGKQDEWLMELWAELWHTQTWIKLIKWIQYKKNTLTKLNIYVLRLFLRLVALFIWIWAAAEK